MPRYDGMDEILERLQTRMVDGAVASERSQPDMSMPAIPPAGDGYAEAVERIMLLLREAQELRSHLRGAVLHTLTQAEHDDVLRQLGKVMRELASCEAALQRAAPVE